MDWNTFLSTISQSAAGLIAIVAAFVISKLLGENEKQEAYESEVSRLIIEYNDIIRRISIRKFGWYDRLNIEFSTDLVDAINEGQFANLNEDDKLNLLFSIESHLFKTEGCLKELNTLIEKYSAKSSGFGRILPALAPRGLWDKLGAERELINQLQVDSFTLINKFKDVKSDFTITKKGLDSFKYTLYILGIGFFVSVIYPLHFMPMAIGQVPVIDFSVHSLLAVFFSIKGLFLFLISLVIIMIFGYFILVVQGIKKKYSILEMELKDDFLKIEKYCFYFK